MGVATGGVLSGLMAGWERGDQKTRERVADQRQAEEYDYSKNRRKVVDGREDRKFDEYLTDLQRARANQDKAGSRDDVRWGWDVDAKAHEKERQPILEARDDTQYGLNVEQAKLNIAGSKQRMAVTAENQANQRKVQQRAWSQAELQDHVDDAKRKLAPAFMHGADTGDWGPTRDAWNATMGSAGGQRVDDIKQGPNGSIVVIVGGKPKSFASLSEFQGFVSNALDPTAAFQHLDQQRTAAAAPPDPAKLAEHMQSFYQKQFDSIMKQSRGTQEAIDAANAKARQMTEDHFAGGMFGLGAAPPPPPAEQQSGSWLPAWLGGGTPAAAAPAAGLQGRPTGPGEAPQVPESAVRLLRSDPKLAKQFDAKYGQGAAARYLQQ